MNLIGLIFSILTLLSFTAIVSLEKETGARRLYSTYLGHLAANRDILRQATSALYQSIPHISQSQEKQEQSKKKEPQNTPLPTLPSINPFCARINLFPLIEKGPEEERILYESIAKLLRVFYEEKLFKNKNRGEYQFLDFLIQAIRDQPELSRLEKVVFQTKDLQNLYYKMLKGTKTSDLIEGIGYPSLLDYITISQTPSKICMFHAHPNLFILLLKGKHIRDFYTYLHTSPPPTHPIRILEKFCQKAHTSLLNPEVLNLFENDRKQHPREAQMTLIGTHPETKTSLRKIIDLL